MWINELHVKNTDLYENSLLACLGSYQCVVLSQDFEFAIEQFRRDPLSAFPAFHDQTRDDSRRSACEPIKVCVRKRPHFAREVKSGEFDVVTALGSRHVAVSDGRMEADMVHMKMAHSLFPFDQVFDEHAQNDTVYVETARPLVQLAVNGGLATCFM